MAQSDLTNKNVIIHVGFHKTGTTFLQEYFKNNPAVWYDQTFFESYRKTGKITKEQCVSEQQLKQNTIVLSEEQITVWSGALNPIGARFHDYGIEAHQKETAKKLFEFYPEAKILITIRGFDTLLPSLYSQYVLNGGVQFLGNFLKTQEKSKLTTLFNYDFVYSVYSNLFGKGNVCVLPYELLKENPKTFVKTLERELSIPYYEFSTSAVNRSPPKFYLYMMVCVSNVILLLTYLLPKNTQLKIYSKYVSFILHMQRVYLDRLKGKFIRLDLQQVSSIYKIFERKADVVSIEMFVQSYKEHYVHKK